MDAGLARCEIAALTVYQDQLVACGDLGVDILPGRFPAARWDGTTWQQIGPDAYRYKGMKAMTVHEGQLIIGGRPTTLADMTAALVLRWSGTAWDTLGIGAGSDEVDALVSRDGVLYAAGALDGLAGGPVARWDGATWRRLAPFSAGVVRTLRIDGDAIIAGGRFTLDDGSVQSVVRWTEAGTDTFASLNGLVSATASFGQRLVAAGGDLSAGPIAEPVALSCAQWVDGAWMSLGGQASGFGLIAPRGGLVCAFRSEGDTLIAGGRFEFARDGRRWVPMANVARWDGAHWSALGSEIVGTVCTFARYRGELIAAGAFQGGSGDEHIENIARWDGERWRPFGGGIRGIGVSVLLVAGDSLVAAGLFGSAGGVPVGDIARWNGDSWAPIGPVYTVGVWDYVSITALAVHDGALIRVSPGSSLSSYRPLVSRWDGVAWQQMNAGLPFSVTVLGSYQGQLVAAGLGGLARWDGSQWNPLAGAPHNISALEPDGDTLYVAGQFEGAGAIHSPGIMRWTGSGWQGLGSGLEPADAFAIARYRGGLFVGGPITTAGGKRSTYVARWGEAYRASAPGFSLEPGRPNPFTREVSVPFSLAAAQRVQVFVVDLSGRRVRTLIDRDLADGTHAAVWDGLADGGRRARPGVYYVVLHAKDAGRKGQRVVLLP